MKKDFVKSNLFTGFIALLPLALLFIILVWLYNLIAKILNPITRLFVTQGILINTITILGLLIVVFLIGLSIRTRPGIWFSNRMQKYILIRIPGYKTIKDILKPFTGEGYKKSFKGVALVNLYENSVLVTAFITDKSEKKGYTTVFIPTGPNPTNGQIAHLKNKFVHPIDISVDKVLKSVIAVGSGSRELIEKYKNK